MSFFNALKKHGKICIDNYFNHSRLPHLDTINVYWWAKKLNFGDVLTPLLVMRYGKVPIHTTPGNYCDLVSTGSILQEVPANFNGKILGTGLKDQPLKKLHFPYAKVVAVRGYRTLENVQCDTAIIGDPGLIACDLDEHPVEKKYELGIIYHFKHKEELWIKDLKAKYAPLVNVISAVNKPGHVLREIKMCNFIASSALHGIICADSFGIPNILLQPPERESQFKYLDYFSSVERNVEFFNGNDRKLTLNEIISSASIPPSALVDKIKKDLRMAFKTI